MDPIQLLRSATYNMTPDDASKMLSESRVAFQIGGTWYRFREGQFENSNGDRIQAMPSAITAMKMMDDADLGQPVAAPVRPAVTNAPTTAGVNAPTWHKADAIKGVAGGPLEPLGSLHGEAGIQAEQGPPRGGPVPDMSGAQARLEQSKTGPAPAPAPAGTPVPIPGVTA